MPFVATWVDLKIVTLSKVGQKKKNTYDVTYLWNLKYNTNKPVYKKETN